MLLPNVAQIPRPLPSFPRRVSTPSTVTPSTLIREKMQLPTDQAHLTAVTATTDARDITQLLAGLMSYRAVDDDKDPSRRPCPGTGRWTGGKRESLTVWVEEELDW